MLNATRLLALAILLALSLTACGGGSGGSSDFGDAPTAPTSPGGGNTDDDDDKSDDDDTDAQKPMVMSTSPAGDSESVNPEAAINAVFNQELDPASVTTSNIRLEGPNGSETLTLSITDKMVVINPARALVEGARYTVTIGSSVANKQGRNLGDNYSWTFRVRASDAEASPPPVIVSTDPVDQAKSVAVDTRVFVAFDQAIDPSSVDASTAELTGPNGNVAVDVSVEENEILLSPKSALSGGASYTVTLDSSVRSLDGEPMGQDYSWQFVTEKTLVGVCSDFYSSGFSLIEGKDMKSPASSLSKPSRGSSYTDPAYKSCVTRASDAKGEHGIGWVRNDYSRRQAFNADESRFLTLGRYSRWFINDTNTTKTIREVPLGGGSVEPQWHPTNPDLIFVFDNNGGYTIRTHNVKTDERRVVADFRKVNSIAGYPGATSITDVWSNAARLWTRWEGSPSADGRYWGLMVQTSDQRGLGMITYDMETNTITGVYDYARDGGGVGEPDHLSMSASGKFIVPSWTSPKCASASQLGTRGSPCGLMSFSRDFSKAVGLSIKASHSDIGYDANGRDVIVGADYETGWLEMWDLSSGARTHLWYIWENGGGTALHVSAKSYNKPGWVLVSTYAGNGTVWHKDKIMAVEMKANPRILNIAHTYNRYSTYWTEPHASVNRDFTRILFNSNWRSGNEDTDTYMITLPNHAVPYQ